MLSTKHVNSPIYLDFKHGVGDCVHFAKLAKVYRNHGVDLRVNFPAHKQMIGNVLEIPQHKTMTPIRHTWWYLPCFNCPRIDGDWQGSKIAMQINAAPLPTIGERESVWEALCGMNTDGLATLTVDKERAYHTAEYLEGLPRPIILTHTQGISFKEHKNLPYWLVLELHGMLLSAGLSVISLDPASAVPLMAHKHYRNIWKWKLMELEDLAALMREADLLVGVDSGPYHFAALTTIPVLGVFTGHYPSCVGLPRTKTVNMVPNFFRLLNKSKERWNLVEYPTTMPACPTAQAIADEVYKMMS